MSKGRSGVAAFLLLAGALCIAGSGAVPPAASVAIAAAASPESQAEQFARGNKDYQEGRFAEAAAEYEAILAEGVEAPGLYYNLANAHLKAGNLGLAIANYDRARILAPRDVDVRSNLEYARSLAQDVKPPDAPGFMSLIATWLSDSLRPRQAAPLASIAWFATFAALGLLLLFPRRAAVFGVLAAVAGSVFVLVAIVLTVGVIRESTRVPGVIVAAEVSVRSGPGENYTAQFNLHEGAEVTLKRRDQDWVEIRIGSEFQGWVPAKAIVQVWPPEVTSPRRSAPTTT